MKSRFVTYNELLIYFTKRKLRDDLLNMNTVGISSISDFLYITEQPKKNAKCNFDIMQCCEAFKSDICENGIIHVAELDKDTLEEAIFTDNDEEIILWNEAIKSFIEPRHSVTYLVLKKTPSTWWDEDILADMKAEYNL